MNPYYNQNYTREEIQNVLDKIKTCVSLGKYTISLNEKRQENIEFINEYNIRSDKQKSILMQIEVEDFCHTLQNTKPGYEYEILYVFVPQVNFITQMERKKPLIFIQNLISSTCQREIEPLLSHSTNVTNPLTTYLDDF